MAGRAQDALGVTLMAPWPKPVDITPLQTSHNASAMQTTTATVEHAPSVLDVTLTGPRPRRVGQTPLQTLQNAPAIQTTLELVGRARNA